MKNISKRIACIALSLLCVFMSTYTVYAGNSAEGDWEHLSNGHVVVNGVEYEPMEHNQYAREIFAIANKLGIVGKGATSLANTALVLSDFAIKDDAGNMYFRIDRKTEDGDNIKFSSDYVNGVRNGIANIIQTEDGYSFVPTLKCPNIPFSFFKDERAFDCYYKYYKETFSSGNFIGVIDGDTYIAYNSWSQLANLDDTKYLYFDSSFFDTRFDGVQGNRIVFHNGVKPVEIADHTIDLSSSLSDFHGQYYDYIDYYATYPTWKVNDKGTTRILCIYTSDGRTLKVYNSLKSLENAIDNHGVQNFYTSNTYNNYNVNNDNSITINKKVYNDTDYESINNNNYTTINKTVNNYYEENNSTIDTSSVEDIIKKFQEDQAKRDQELLDKVEDNNNKTDKGNQINKETNEKLDKIYEILQQIAGSLSGGSGGDSGASGSDFDMNTLIQMLNNLQLSLDTMWQVDLKQIQSNLNTIVNDLKSDNADSKSILEDIYKTQQQILEVQQANLNQNKTFFDSVIDYLKKITHALTAGNIIDTLDTLLNLKDDADGLGDFVDGIVGDIKPTVSLMKTKFPTSIPWDIIAVISVMACDPQTPRFEIPINIDIMGQKYEDVLVIDLEQFDRVARFGRALLSVMFTLWLLLVTKRLLYGGES